MKRTIETRSQAQARLALISGSTNGTNHASTNTDIQKQQTKTHYPKNVNPIIDSDSVISQQKQDCVNAGNVVQPVCKEPTTKYPNTYHKLNQSKQNVDRTKYITIHNNKGSSILENLTRKRFDKFNKTRSVIFNIYSKMQYCFNLSMESLFLAIDIFDKYTDICHQSYDKQFIQQDLYQIALACFMIAIKYQQVYPPPLNQIQSKMRVCIKFRKYVQLELKILQKLDYNLTMDSPIKYFNQISHRITDQKKSFIYLNLQLSTMNISIKKNYSWLQIIKAIKFLFMPLTTVAKIQTQSRIFECFKQIMEERNKLNDSYSWVEKKYSDSRFHYMALQVYFAGDDE